MPLYILIPTIIIFILLTALFAILFWKEQKHPKPNHFPDRSIRKFFKDGLSTIYIIVATIFGLSVIAIITIAING